MEVGEHPKSCSLVAECWWPGRRRTNSPAGLLQEAA